MELRIYVNIFWHMVHSKLAPKENYFVMYELWKDGKYVDYENDIGFQIEQEYYENRAKGIYYKD